MQAGQFNSIGDNRQVHHMWHGDTEISCAAPGVPVSDLTGSGSLGSMHVSNIGIRNGSTTATVAATAAAAASLAAFHQQYLGVNAAILNGALQQQATEAGGMFSEPLKQHQALPVGLGPMAGGSAIAHLSPEWQQTMAIAHHAAAAGQMAANFPLLSGGQTIGNMQCGMSSNSSYPGSRLQGASNSIASERELKRQRRKLSNRESARRSRLRKQAELQEMIEEVQACTVKNAHLKLEAKHLRECMARIKDQNLIFKGIISRANEMQETLMEIGMQQAEKEGHETQQEQQQTCWAAVSGLLNAPQASDLDQSVV